MIAAVLLDLLPVRQAEMKRSLLYDATEATTLVPFSYPRQVRGDVCVIDAGIAILGGSCPVNITTSTPVWCNDMFLCFMG